MNDRISTSTYLHGRDGGDTPPLFIGEIAILRALQKTLEHLEKAESAELPAIRIRAGGPATCPALGNWLNTGIFGLRSAAASPTASLSTKLVELTNCPILAEWTEHSESFQKRKYQDSDMDDPRDVIGVPRLRFIDYIHDKAMEKRGERIARLPLTQEEIKTRIKTVFEQDEMRAIERLRDLGSTSCGIYLRLGLTRRTIKETLKRLPYCRPLQVTLCSIICATRFKFYENGRLLSTVCQRKESGMVDNFDHLIDCTGLRLQNFQSGHKEEEDEELHYQFLEELAFLAYNVNPGFPKKVN